jgi:Ca2+-binding EF-hand superfamily protein
MQDENTPEKRVNKLFEMMDKDKNQKLDFEGGCRLCFARMISSDSLPPLLSP